MKETKSVIKKYVRPWNGKSSHSRNIEPEMRLDGKRSPQQNNYLYSIGQEGGLYENQQIGS